MEIKKKVLDIRNLSCPMSFLKAKEFLKQNSEYKKKIIIKGEKDLKLLNNSLKRNYKLKVNKRGNVFLKLKYYRITRLSSWNMNQRMILLPCNSFFFYHKNKIVFSIKLYCFEIFFTYVQNDFF